MAMRTAGLTRAVGGLEGSGRAGMDARGIKQ